MLSKEEIGPAWTNFKQFEGNNLFPTVFKFTVFNNSYYAAKDKKNEVFLRKSLAGLHSLTGIPLRVLKKELS